MVMILSKDCKPISWSFPVFKNIINIRKKIDAYAGIKPAATKTKKRENSTRDTLDIAGHIWYIYIKIG